MDSIILAKRPGMRKARPRQPRVERRVPIPIQQLSSHCSRQVHTSPVGIQFKHHNVERCGISREDVYVGNRARGSLDDVFQPQTGRGLSLLVWAFVLTGHQLVTSRASHSMLTNLSSTSLQSTSTCYIVAQSYPMTHECAYQREYSLEHFGSLSIGFRIRLNSIQLNYS